MTEQDNANNGAAKKVFESDHHDSKTGVGPVIFYHDISSTIF